MAHLLMIESWVGASGNLLPPLLKSLGHTYTFVTRKPGHYQNPLSDEEHTVFRCADSVLVTETNDISELLETVKPYQFDGVITVCDYYIDTVREVARELKLPCPFPDKVKEVREKHLIRKALDDAGLQNPKYYLAKNFFEAKKAAKDIGFPLVIKPVDLASSAFVKLINTDEELEEAFRALESFTLNFREQPRNMCNLLEEFMEGKEVSVETVTYKGETTIIGITDKSVAGKPYFIENGHMFPANLEYEVESELKKFIIKVLEAVGFNHGIAHTEIKITGKGFRVVEINPRTAGNYIVELIQNVTGVNMLNSFVDLSLGIKPKILKQDRGIKSSAIMFFVPQKSGVISRIQGKDTLKDNEHVVRYKIEDCVGKHIDLAIDNASYLGHVITKDRNGFNARRFAEDVINSIEFKFGEEELI